MRTEIDQIHTDEATNALTVINYDHHEVHGGSSFVCSYNNDCTNTNEMTVIAFNTADSNKWVHVIAEASATAAAYFAVYENPSIDNGEGTTLTIYNRDRNSSKTSTVSTIEATPTTGSATSFNEAQAAGANITTTTELIRRYIGSGERINASGGDTRGSAEFILAGNTQYAFMVVSTTDDDNTHGIVLDWYEHTNKG